MTVTEFARSRGYPDVKYEMMWKGFEVYLPSITGKTGYPLRILKKGDLIRMTTPNESIEIIRRIN